MTALIDASSQLELSKLRVFKVKRREGVVERLLANDGSCAVCKGFFKKESDFSPFIGLQVEPLVYNVVMIEALLLLL